jgi:hypothetical protein
MIDPLTAADDRGTTSRWVGAEPVGSSTNLYAKFAPAATRWSHDQR